MKGTVISMVMRFFLNRQVKITDFEKKAYPDDFGIK